MDNPKIITLNRQCASKLIHDSKVTIKPKNTLVRKPLPNQ